MGQKLGQHFLKNPKKIREIADSLAIQPGETIIEIGPGKGALTLPILNEIKEKKGARLIIIEKDPILADFLKTKIGKNPQLSIIEGDIREELARIAGDKKLVPGPYRIVGNIPYYLTGYLLRQIGDLTKKPEIIILTIQKEVAERIAAVPPKMNMLAASVQFWAEPRIIDFIPRKEFQPAPQVDSAIIRISPKPARLCENSAAYYETVKKIFRQPRKTLWNNIRTAEKNRENSLLAAIRKIGIDPGSRPQNLSVKNLKEIAEMLYNY